MKNFFGGSRPSERHGKLRAEETRRQREARGAGKYGPNTAQVERFLQRVAELTAAERESIQTEARLARSAFGEKDINIVELDALRKYGPDYEETMLGLASDSLREITKDYGHESTILDLFGFDHLALSALIGLVVCQVMGAPQFAGWYGPFAREIPIESLGGGLAPKIAPAPVLAFQRFLTRVRNVQEWDRIQAVHDMMLILEVAGTNRHKAADEAVTSFLESRMTELSDFERAALLGAMKETQVIGAERLADGERFRRAMDAIEEQHGNASDPEGRASRNEEGRTREDDVMSQFRHCCRDGLFAVAFFTKIPDDHFYYLYLPFEPFIPIDSILP